MVVPSWSSLVAASLLVGQTSQTQVISPPPGSAKTYIYPSGTTPTTVVTQPGDAPRSTWSRTWQERPILTKIQGWFGRGPKQNDVPMTVEPPSFGTPTTTPVVTSPVSIVPNSAPSTTTPTPVAPTPSSSSPTEFLRKMPASFLKTPSTPASTPEATADARTTSRVVQLKAEEASTKKSPLLPQLANKVGRDEKFEWVTGQLEIENGQHVLYYATPETVDPYQGRLVLQTRVDLSGFRRGDLVSAHGQVARTTGLLNGPPAYRATSVDKIESASR